MAYSRITLGILLLVQMAACSNDEPYPPEGFSSIAELDASIELDIRYIGNNNFLGRPVAGYEGAACILSTPAASALVQVQRSANEQGYSLKIYDCFRPQQAVDNFVRWAADADDVVMKASMYPSVPKEELFSRGYIAERSGHSRGSTVDLTLVPLGTHQPQLDPFAPWDCRASDEALRFPDNSIDMGTSYDCFDVLSHTAHPAISAQAMANRLLLKELMEAAGFENYENEWWHYTLQDEPFPDTFFDFPVR
ncbi:M15 family metallopeptidase [Pseudohongiella spirulinae]|uniref:D-alanyl-D-alanine dipeptidase n=1 Tax=Pseudohongiella spirulinae TaxID=1249552 RepID=A0A0S2KED1_9GAMM|nr:M15 family metallopeptidase [Pseudohongiella spirulinae]ALO46669.1 D-alanyl-D-alanine dipeptidase [Pseudohongiella spirulinae]